MNHHSECILDNRKSRKHIYESISLFSEDNAKIKKGWDIPFFDYIKIKWSIWVSYNFKVDLDYSLLYRSIYFWCYDTILKKVFSLEKLNLIERSEQTLSFAPPPPHPTPPHPHKKMWKI